VSAATRFIAAFAAALGLAISGAGVSAAGSSADSTWYWSEYGAAHALYLNGITWRSGVDRMRQRHCWRLGHWLVETDGTRLFSHFYCTATPTSGSRYDVIVNVTGPSLYAVSFVMRRGHLLQRSQLRRDGSAEHVWLLDRRRARELGSVGLGEARDPKCVGKRHGAERRRRVDRSGLMPQLRISADDGVLERDCVLRATAT
jgi:hypothetical protein